MLPWEGEIWDEERWEAYLKARRRQIDRLLEDYFAFTRYDPYPEHALPDQVQAWRQRLRSFLEARGWSQAAIQGLLRAREAGWPFEEEGIGEGESEAEETLIPEAEACRALMAQARALANAVLEWANRLPGTLKTSALVHFCTCLAQIPLELAEGHMLGYERETLGGNIVCARHALITANRALATLAELRLAPYMTAHRYRTLYEEVYELRNALALHVQRLRTRFQVGLD
ncbi:hypothetical protein [Rhodothermus profundi]|uniref:Uncharacterized protein n=1 Tax=Rhodothermus profundi TaxID=633813 RepID=A0A1M6PTH4_9BACT|nr:hypothetical protein [Rhodothermus profundi]SHK11247.1 hypothetical protein SAMN04488087_0317 [Rhodothermus profundi]